MDWLRSEDLKEEKVVTTSSPSVAGCEGWRLSNPNHGNRGAEGGGRCPRAEADAIFSEKRF
jgi:hypothetical protein